MFISGSTFLLMWGEKNHGNFQFLKLGYCHLVAGLLQIGRLNHLHVLIMAVEWHFLFCIDCVQWRSWLECVQINKQSTHVHPESSSTSASFHCVVNAANDRYFVFFLLGPLILSLSSLSFKKGKRKGNINRKTEGRGGMLKRPESACFLAWCLSICLYVCLLS